jgi:hypothetical protein
MKVEIIDDNVVLMFAEKSPGFYRGKAIEYLAFHPDLAIRLGKDLIQLGTMVKEKKK